jgi:hypothetical protein
MAPGTDSGPRDPTFSELRSLFEVLVPAGDARLTLPGLLRRVEDRRATLEALVRPWPEPKHKHKQKEDHNDMHKEDHNSKQMGVRHKVEAVLKVLLPQFKDKASEAIEAAR